MNRRRDFLAMTAGAVAAGAVLPVRAGETALPSPDAALIASCTAFAAACVDLARINATDDPTDEQLDVVVAAWGEPIDAIISTPATTPEGVRAKAGAVAGFFSTGGVSKYNWQTLEQAMSRHEMMAWRLAHEIVAMGSAAA